MTALSRVRHTAGLAPVSEAGPVGRCGDRATPAGSAASGMQTTQTGTNTRSTHMGPGPRSKLPWLATDHESGMEPENVYSQGDQPDPLEAGWERAVGGAVGGVRYFVPPHAALAEETDCRKERMTDYSRPREYSESRPYRIRHPVNRASTSAIISSAARRKQKIAVNQE